MTNLDDERRTHIRRADAETRLTGLGHDALRYVNIVAAIAALLGNVDPEKVDGLPEEYSKWIVELRDAAQRLRDLIDLYAMQREDE